VISAGQVPAGDYTGATLTLDYTNAAIAADDGTGQGVALKPVDIAGNPLTGTVSIAVQLDNRNHLVITPGRTSRLAFDFNLAASNTVDLTAATVQVAPTLVATVVPADTRQTRVRGSLVSAAAAQNEFVLEVEPFHDSSPSGGQVTVQVTSATTYQINGTAYAGVAGIAALAALPASSMIAAFGTVQTGTQTFSATSVLAGSSLENPGKDAVSGTVIARDQTSLTLSRATYNSHEQHDGRDDDFDFELKNVTVNVGANTVVTEEGQMGAFTVADISVGQQVDVFGMQTDSSHGTKTIDATAGEVRGAITPAWGTVTAMATGSLTLNLQSLGGLPPGVFTFTGTGTSAANDAKATAYVVDTAGLDLTTLAVNAPARVFGFVTPFGSAPADFTAATLVNFSGVTAGLVVDWGKTGSPTALTGLSATSTALELSLAGVGARHFVQIGPERLDLATLSSAASIVPDATATADVFTVGHAEHFRVENFSTFADFAAELSQDLTGSTTVIVVAASGQYDSAKNTFTATRLAVLLSN
jgi:hypothetical protein